MRHSRTVPRSEIVEEGYFVHPVVIGEVAPTARVAQEEIFGPVLSAIRAASFEEAVYIANSTDSKGTFLYAGTGQTSSPVRESTTRVGGSSLLVMSSCGLAA